MIIKTCTTCFNRKVSFRSRARLLFQRTTSHGTLILLFCGISLPALAELDDVMVNGETIEATEIQRYKDIYLTQRHCYPETDRLALHRVVARQLLESPSAGLANVENEIPTEPELLYLKLLRENSPLIVDVAMLRTATMTFSTRVEAEEVLERLQTGEAFDELASEFNQAGYDHDAAKEIWHHAGTLAPSIDQQPLAEGSLLNTWFDGSSWQVRQVLEAKQKPVLLLDDIIESPDKSVEGTIGAHAQSTHKQELIKRLWESADISVGGNPLAYSDESYCDYPALQLNTEL